MTPPRVDEDVIESPLGIGDALEDRTTGASSTKEGHLVGHLIADERLDQVVEVGHIHLVRAHTRGNRPPVGIDRLEDAQIVGEVGGVAAEAGEDPLGYSVTVSDRCLPGLLDGGASLG